MQTTKPRSVLSSPSSKQAPKWGKGMSFSLDSSEAKVFDRKPSLKSPSSLEKRTSREEQVSHLQEELRKAKEEKSRALEELEESKRNKTMPPAAASENSQKEVEKAKESERKMLESLIEQTKQFEQTKISLEEAKLEIRSLRDSIKSSECSMNCNGGGSRGLAKSQSDRNLAKLDDPPADDQLDVIRVTKELRLATAAEEKSKKAMDGLALALKEVSTEANRAKARLSTSQTELERARSEAERSRAALAATVEKLRAAEEECRSLRSKAEDSATIWSEKENGFINCMKASEEETADLRGENGRLVDSLRICREDHAKLRDVLKHAVNEATVVKEALEIARDENSRLKDLLAVKEKAYQSIRQEYECLKVSEAAASDSVKELKGFLAAASGVDYPDVDYRSSWSPAGTGTAMSERWRAEPRMRNGRRHSLGGSHDPNGLSVESSGQVLGSVSNVSDSRTPSSLFTYDTEASNSGGELIRTDRTALHGSMRGAGEERKKKKPILRRFGDMLRRRSFHK